MSAESGLVFVAGRYLDLLRERDALAAEVAQLRQQLTLSRLAQFEPMGDNHHNAAACPYCSPDRRVSS